MCKADIGGFGPKLTKLRIFLCDYVNFLDNMLFDQIWVQQTNFLGSRPECFCLGLYISQVLGGICPPQNKLDQSLFFIELSHWKDRWQQRYKWFNQNNFVDKDTIMIKSDQWVKRGNFYWKILVLHSLSDSTTDKPSFDVKWTDLIGRAGGQDMFFL